MMIRTARKRPTSALRAGLVSALLAAPLVFVPLGVTAEAAPPTELFMSEYIEGSSFNKAIEIYNGTGAPVDLEAGGYTLELYSNGFLTEKTVQLMREAFVAPTETEQEKESA